MVRHTEYCKQAAAGVRSEANIETCAPAAAPNANRMQSAVFHGWLLEACARVFSICFSTYVGGSSNRVGHTSKYTLFSTLLYYRSSEQAFVMASLSYRK